MPAPNNPLINDLTKRDQYLSQLASLQKPQLPAQSYGFQNMVMREPPQNGLVSVQAPPPQAPPAQAPQAQKPKASFQPKKAYSRPVDTQRSRIMADEAYQNELKGYESQISQGYPVDPLARRRTAERYRNEIARLDAIDNAAEREDYGNRERARRASNAAVGDEMAGQALDESSAAFAKSTPSAPVVKRNPDGTPTTADPYQYGSLSPNRPANLDRGQGPFTPEPPGPSSSPVPPGPPRQSIDSILDGLRQFQGQSTPQPPFVQALREAVAKSTTGQLGALAAPPQAPEPNKIAPTVPTSNREAAPAPGISQPAPTQGWVPPEPSWSESRPNRFNYFPGEPVGPFQDPAPARAPRQELDPLSDLLGTGLRPYQPVQNTNPTLMQGAPTLDPAFLEQMRQQGTVPQRVLTPEELSQGTPRGVGEQFVRSSIGVGGLLGPPMPYDYDTNPTTVAGVNELAVDKFGAEMNAGIQGMVGGAAGGNLNANRKPAPGSGMRPAATVQEGPVVQGQTNPRVKATLGRTGPLQYEVTPGQEGKVVDRPNVPYPDPLQLPKPAVVDPAAQALENLTRTNAQNEAARRRTVETAPTRKAAAEKKAAQDAIDQEAFGKAQDRKEAVRVQAVQDKANLEKNPVNPITGEKQFPTDAQGAPAFTTEQLAKRSGIKGGTTEAGPVSQALADKQANKKALVEAANKGDMAAVDKLLAEGKAIDARARAAEEKSKTVVAKAGAQGASFARDLAGRVALARQRAGLTFDQTALPLEGTSTRKPARASEPEPQTGIEVLAKPTTAEPIARTQPTAPSEAKDAKRQRPVDLPAPVEQRAKAVKQAPKVVETTPTDAKKVESTSTPSTPEADQTQKKVDRVERAFRAGAITELERDNEILDLKQRASIEKNGRSAPPKAKTSSVLDGVFIAAIEEDGQTDAQVAKLMRLTGLTDEKLIAKEIKRIKGMIKGPEPVSPPAPPIPSDRPTIPVVPEAKPRVETPVKPTPRSPVKKAIAAITGQDKRPISTPADKPKTVAPKDETADRVKRAKKLKAQTDLIEKNPKGKK